MSLSVGIIGAGLAGLTAARHLQAQGISVELFEKARGPGGRMATRRTSDYMFDHGAQYFTVSDSRFSKNVIDWIAQGLVSPWQGRIGVAAAGTVNEISAKTPRYVSIPRMSALTRHLSEGLDAHYSTRIESVALVDREWVLESDGNEVGRFDALIVTTPPQQALPLLRDSPKLASDVGGVSMLPCWALMLVFEERLEIDLDGIFVSDAPISWVARNSSKPGRPLPESWVVHASPHWSADNLELEPEEAVRRLLPVFFRSLGLPDARPEHVQAHRWRFAQPEQALNEECLWDNAARIAVAGDWVNGAKVEGAFLSGLAAAQRIMKTRADR